MTDFIEHHRNGKLPFRAGDQRCQAFRIHFQMLRPLSNKGSKKHRQDHWFAFWAPAKTPATIITRRNREIVEVLQMSDVRERLLKLGQEPISSTPEELAQTDGIGNGEVGAARESIRIHCGPVIKELTCSARSN